MRLASWFRGGCVNKECFETEYCLCDVNTMNNQQWLGYYSQVQPWRCNITRILSGLVNIYVENSPDGAVIRRLDSSHKSHNALNKYPTVHHFVPEMCTFLFQIGALWDMGLVNCGIRASGLVDFVVVTGVFPKQSVAAEWPMKIVVLSTRN